MRKDSFSLPNVNCRYNDLGLVVSYDPVLDVAPSVICQSGAEESLIWTASNQPNLVGGYVTVLRHSTGSLTCPQPNPVAGNCSCNSTAGGSYTSIATSTYTDTTVYGIVLTYSAYLCVKTVKVFGQTLMNCSIGVECSCPTGKPVAYTLLKSGLMRGLYMCL